MLTFETVKELDSHLDAERAEGKKVGFVPTMGALHEGHMSLIQRSQQENDLSVVSVFVNPAQFNDKKDLDNYPRDIEGDKRLLSMMNCNVLFYPSVQEIYPEESTEHVDLGGSVVARGA